MRKICWLFLAFIATGCAHQQAVQHLAVNRGDLEYGVAAVCGGMCACAIDKCVTIGSFGGNRVVPSGNGNWNPSELSNGSPEIAAKRPFHIMLG